MWFLFSFIFFHSRLSSVLHFVVGVFFLFPCIPSASSVILFQFFRFFFTHFGVSFSFGGIVSSPSIHSASILLPFSPSPSLTHTFSLIPIEIQPKNLLYNRKRSKKSTKLSWFHIKDVHRENEQRERLRAILWKILDQSRPAASWYTKTIFSHVTAVSFEYGAYCYCEPETVPFNRNRIPFTFPMSLLTWPPRKLLRMREKCTEISVWLEQYGSRHSQEMVYGIIIEKYSVCIWLWRFQ